MWLCRRKIFQKTVQIILTQQVVSDYFSKDEATNFYPNIEDTNDFKSMEYKTILIGCTTAAN